ncbi:MAG: permease [Pleomorphochaeta sp.]|nr:permease [Sphaerochaetaceae bacterium]
MKTLKSYLMTIIAISVLVVMFFFDKPTANDALNITFSSILSMLKVLPPILIIMNSLDIIIPKEIIIKHMGEDSGIRGYFWALILGTFAAGPLYAAFPIAAMLAKKEAKMAYLIFFLGMWTVTKLPVFTFELNFFGASFTLLHVLTGIIYFFILSLFLEKFVLKKNKPQIYKQLNLM